MSLLFPARARPKETREESPAWLQTIQRFGGERGDSGVYVDTEQALSHSAVYACVDLLADTVSSFPVGRYRDVEETIGGQPRKTTTQVHGRPTVAEQPSNEIDPVNWRRLLVVGWLLRGYSPGLVTQTRNGYPRQIELIHPDRVTFHRKNRDSPLRTALDGKQMERYPVGRLWVANGKMLNPEDGVGRSVLEFARAEIGIGLASRKFGAEFFRDGGHPTAVLMNDKKIEGIDEGGARRVRERFMRAMRGNREPAIMTDGWRYEQIQVRPNESQFLESIGASRAMVASFFRVPPSAIGATVPGGAEITYQNAEQRGLDLLKFTVQTWIVRMETVLNPLLVRPEYVRLNVDEMLRSDRRSRYESHDTSIRSGWKTGNEVRADEGLPPVDGGDQLLWPPYRSILTDVEKLGDPDEGVNEPIDAVELPVDPSQPPELTPPEEQPSLPPGPRARVRVGLGYGWLSEQLGGKEGEVLEDRGALLLVRFDDMDRIVSRDAVDFIDHSQEGTPNALAHL